MQIQAMTEGNFEAAFDHIQAGGAIKDLSGVAPEQLQAYYSLAYNFYQSGNAINALKIFKFLCIQNHLNKEYFMGLGASHKKLKNYTEAADAFAYVMVLDIDDPYPIVLAGECHLLAGNKQFAIDAFTFAAELPDVNPAQLQYVEKANAWLQKIKMKREASNEH